MNETAEWIAEQDAAIAKWAAERNVSPGTVAQILSEGATYRTPASSAAEMLKARLRQTTNRLLLLTGGTSADVDAIRAWVLNRGFAAEAQRHSSGVRR